MLNEISYYETIGGKSRLLYTDRGARLLALLAVPAHRLAQMQGKWPNISLPPRETYLLEIIKNLSNIPAQPEILALSAEEEAVGKALLDILAYAQGRGLDIGRAVMLVHLKRSEA